MSKCLFAAAMIVAAFGAASAQDYPKQTIMLTTGYAAGGYSDVTSRIVAEGLRPKLGQPVIVNNRPGASGTLAVAAVAKSAPDGYNFLMATNAEVAALPALKSDLPYDMDKDFTPISLISDTPLIIIAHAGSKLKSVADLLKAGGENSEEILYATPAVGSTHHLLAESMAVAKGIKMVHVPYRGGGPAATAVAGGEVPIGIVGITTAIPLIQTGRVVALAVSGKQRIDLMPEVPTLIESGLNISTSLWVGMYGPAGLSHDVTSKIHKAVVETLALPKSRELMAAQASVPVGSSGEELVRRRQEEFLWSKGVAARANIRLKD